MTHYQSLSTTKYYNDAIQQENNVIRRQKNRDAIRAFTQFIFALGVFATTWYAIEQMPNWLPVVQTFMDEKGVTAVLQKWVG